ncbi:MAG: hypothetical protein Q4C13_07870, partial [Clostridia bacterium]|nr:hypothetical protein [Clostridia bacterium]
AILSLLGEHYKVSRAYIFEDTPDHRACSNTYEWCAEGVTPQRDQLQNVSYEDDLGGTYHDLFNEDRIFFCPDIHDLPDGPRNILKPQGIHSMLQCAIVDAGVFHGFVGFDDCTGDMTWTDEQTGTLSLVSMIIGIFLIKRLEHSEALFSADFRAALENNDSFIYIIDPASFEVIYSNKAIRSFFGADYEGAVCHKEFMNCDTPCDFCPAVRLRDSGSSEPVEICRPDGLWILTQASALYWKGRNVVMLICTNISRQKEAEEALRIRSEEYAIVVRQSGKSILRYDLHTGAATSFFGAAPPFTEGAA